MNQYRKTFEEKGFVVIPGVIAKEKISQLRESYTKVLNEQELLTISPIEFLKHDVIAGAPFAKEVVEAINQTLGAEGFNIYPDFTVRQSLYIPWHTDTSFLSDAEAHASKQADFVQCSIYLQDNNWDTGGGLEVISGSHLDKNVNRKRPQDSESFSCEQGGELAASKAGDLVLWDSRVVHRSILNKEPDQPKLAVQWTISKTHCYSQNFIGYIQARLANSTRHVSDQKGRENVYLQGVATVADKYFKPELLKAINDQHLSLHYLSQA